MGKSKLALITTATVMIICLVSQVAQVSAAAAYQDEFSTTTLQSYWTFANPAGTGSYSLTAHSGYLRITAVQNSKLSITSGSNTNAPRMLQSVTGSFSATTYVTSTGFTSANYRAGLVLWKDQNNFIRLEKYGSTQVLLYTIIEGVEAYQTASITSSNNLYLKLDKSGTTITGYYSTNGASWITIKSYTYTAANPLQIGLFVINADATSSSFSVDFDYFRVTPYSTVTVLPEYPVGILGASAAIVVAWVFFKVKGTTKILAHL